jgi:hypothetical protein
MADAQSITARMIVYGLVDSSAPEVIRYVGKTAATRRAERLVQHFSRVRKGCQTYKARWMRAALAAGHEIIDVVLQECETEAEAFIAERAHIARLLALGVPLTNLTEGGEGPIGLRWSEASRIRVGKQRRGRVTSPETKQKLRATQIGRTRSAETRKKMSDAAKRRSPDHYRNSITATRGWSHTPEARQRMSEARRRNAARKPEAS